jgi:hypothetical protein
MAHHFRKGEEEQEEEGEMNEIRDIIYVCMLQLNQEYQLDK